jgi:general secretion pathway protein A
MYLDFFSLSERPFDLTPNTRFFYLSSQHEEAVESLKYGIENRLGFMILTGEVGTGKTTTLRSLLRSLPKTVETALIFNPLMSKEELLEAIIADFGIPKKKSTSRQLLDVLYKFLLEANQKGKNAVVMIDEAQLLSFEAMEMVRLLSNLETEDRKLLQIVLSGQPELEAKLEEQELRQLRQRVQLHLRLKPLDYGQVKEYINWRIEKSSSKACLVIEEAAYHQIYKSSRGIPRIINNLSDKCLMAAYVRETRVITSEIVQTASMDMGIYHSTAKVTALLKRLKFWAA